MTGIPNKDGIEEAETELPWEDDTTGVELRPDIAGRRG